MKININIPVTPKRIRILAGFMAFLIFALTFQQAFVGWGGFKVSANTVSGDGTRIYQTSGATGSVSHSTSSIYSYQSNKYQTSSVTLFDFVSDEEIIGTYNSISNSNVSGYTDSYTQLNSAISYSSITSLSSNNITFVYKKNHQSVGGVNVYLYTSDGQSLTAWPGDSMTYNSKYEYYTFTVDCSGWGNTEYIGVIFNEGSNWQTNDLTGTTISKANSKGKSYTYSYTSWSNDRAQVSGPTIGTAYNIYNTSSSCSYTYPLYFGAFIKDNEGYTSSTVPNYNNFYWLPNMAPRQHTEVSVQGLVNGTLSGGSTGSVLDRDGSTVLPYLNTSWADSHPSLVKYYNKDRNGNPIAFPFYEVRAGANQGAVSKKTSGSNISNEYAKFYQFKSSETSVRFDIAETNGTDDPSLHQGEFVETSVAKYSSLSKVGFFPFESANHPSQNNLGFGAKFEMEFKLEPDGCVSPVGSDGSLITDSDTRIDTVFEFTGDDDLWVFIDGNLVLDMGGDHGESSGTINFRTKTATANSAVTIGDGNLYDLTVSGSALSSVKNENVGTASETFGFTSKLADAAYYQAHKEYNPNTLHTMTIFYMERGMYDSNLMIRYNYATVNNSPKMKIQEITDFSGVNDGLLAYTQKAADKDAFEYTVYNNGTASNDVKDSDAAYPTTVSHIRNNYYDPDDSTVYQSTPLTPNGTETSSVSNFSPSGTNTFDPVTNTTYAWVDKFANMYSASKGGDGKGAGKTDANGKLYIMYGTADKESSAEFEKQFSKYSYMRIIQGDNLYRQGSASSGGSTYYTLNNSSGRTLSDYYTLTRVHTLDAGQEVVNDLTTTYKADPTAYSFQFVNDASVSSNVATMMTEYFTNTVNVGAISVTKNLDPADNVDDLFEFQLQFTKIFGETVTMTASDYAGIAITGASDSNGDTITELPSGGKFYLRKGETATISGIPVDSAYTITETFAGSNYEQKSTSGTLSSDSTTTSLLVGTIVNTRLTGSLTLNKVVNGNTSLSSFDFTVTLSAPNGVNLSNYTITDGTNTYTTASFTVSVTPGTPTTISGIPYGTTYTVTETQPSGASAAPAVSGGDNSNGTGTIDGSGDSVTITNTFPADTPVTVTKSGNPTDDMSGAEFELWYKETVPPQTYSFNEPKIAPNEINGMKVTDTPASVGVPSPEVPESITNYTVTTNYTDPSVPNADEKEWILPRNDTDYIYFRDYNTGTTGWEDKPSYTQSATGFAAVNNGDRRTWRATNFTTHSGHSQNLELSYDESYWFAAEFSGTGKITRRYSMWERFVDEFTYNDGTQDVTQTTTVWKIQPPDGYTTVRFMLMQGDTCVRKTAPITYQLGKIYHKTSWGGYYTTKDGKKCYYDVPYEAEGYWAPHDATAQGGVYDKRNSGSTMLQARKYEPTAQKVIFHCDSTRVWHNIHIEFFTEGTAADHDVDEDGHYYKRVNGQAFPGYMMEPYAYAGNDYRVEQYLTYELTIPKGATHFRVNNGEAATTYHGETAGTYSYRSAITELKTAVTGGGKKNYNNYWEIASESYPIVTLTTWNGNPEGTPNLDYKNAEVTSDYDYIYFKNTDNWSKVYAYFYAGGDLRGDNWQRATYSSWPGVAPAGTEYNVSGGTSVHSNTYTNCTTDNEYNGTTTGGTLNPVATFTSGSYTIYKFRIPKGDRKNYSKVIFNSGLGGTETGVIDYQPGHIYDKDGKSEKHYENSPTKLYTASTNNALSGTDKTEYIYVKNTLNWDDLHVTFYDANGGQILQGGKGYVMEYAGNDGDNYFKIPLPEDAVSFSVNNGMGSANSSKVSQKADIIRLNGTVGDPDNGKTKSTKGADDRFVYTLSGAGTTESPYKLTRDGFSTQSVAQTPRPTPQEEGFSGYTVATAATATAPATYTVRTHGTSPNIVEHTLNIRDAANWNVAIGRISVTFYTSAGAQIGPNVMIKTVEDSQDKVWYTKKIHPNATSFTVTYSNNSGTYTTPKYPIYPYSANAPEGGTNYTSTGHMFFDTVGTGANSKLVMTHEEPVNADNAVDDETYAQRGDYLYLIYPSNGTKEVTFYASGTNVIKSGIKAKYINHDSEGNWYKVAIPTGAQSFTATGMSDTKPIYELRSKFSPYKKDYTLGDMQYRINGSATLVYPVFTADTYNTLDVYKDGGVTRQITSQTNILVDESEVAGFSGAGATLPTATSGTDYSTPTKEILYNTVTTDQDNITYSWTEGGTGSAEDNYYEYIRFAAPTVWTDVKAYFFDPDTSISTGSYTTWDNSLPMTDTGESYTNGSYNRKVWKIRIPKCGSDYLYRKAIFYTTASTSPTQTVDITLSMNSGDTYGTGEFYYAASNTSDNKKDVLRDNSKKDSDPNYPNATDNKLRFDDLYTNWGSVKVKFYNSGGSELGSGYYPMDSDGDYIHSMDIPSAIKTSIAKVQFFKSSDTSKKTNKIAITNYGQNKICQPSFANSDRTMLYWAPDTNWRNVQIAYVYAASSGNSTSYHSGWSPDGRIEKSGIKSPNGDADWYYAANIPDSVNYVRFKSIEDQGTMDNKYVQTGRIKISDIPPGYGVRALTCGNGTSNHDYTYEFYPLVGYNLDGSGITWAEADYKQPVSTITLTYSYQPEDRYGMISDQNTTTGSEGVLGRADVNDFIKVVLPSSVATPYIKFYSDTSGTTEINSGTSTKGLLLKPNNGGGSSANNMTLNSTTYTPETATANTYMVRLPKDAGSFEILDGTTSKFTQTLKETNVQTTMTALDENNQPINQTVTVPGTFYHAGTTFDFTTTPVTKTLRTGFTPYKQSTMVDPLDPMTDNDFIYFTDTGSFASGGKVFAYFYGDADGEYKSWPGSYATTSNALSYYKDNSGKTVYKFRVPKDSDGSYTKVIFNNGQSGNNLNITAAQTVAGGMNYILSGVTSPVQDYGTMTATNKVFAVTNAAATDKSSTPTATYSNSANKTIYFINNGTKCDVAAETDLTGGRYILDDIHVEFFTSEGSGAIGTADPGYIPEKVGTYNQNGISGTVYRIVAPNNAQYFRINNGTGKGAVNGHNHDRKSEVKLLTNNGLYSFVTDATKYTKDGSRPDTVQALSQPEYLLELVNKRDMTGDDDQPDAEYFDVKLATVVTKNDGTVDKIIWLRDYPNAIDTAYLSHTASDINDTSVTEVKVVKEGTYYWKEVTPPSGYKLPSTTIQTFTLPTTGSTTTTFTDPQNDTGSLTIKKKLYSVDTTDPIDPVEEEKNKRIKFTIELIAPIGTNWGSTNLSSTVTIMDKDGHDKSNDSGWFVSDDKDTTTSLVRTVVVKLPADGLAYVTIDGLPYGTTYSVTEQPIKTVNGNEVTDTDYTSEPIIINKSVKETSSSTAEDSTEETVDGTVENYSTSYLLTNKHEVGSLNLKDIVVDHGVNALYHANVNQPDNSYDPPVYNWYPYNYEVTLISPDYVDLDDYISVADLNAISGITTSGNVVYTARTANRSATAAQSQYKFHIHVTSAPDGMRTISNIPLGTQYIVTEELPTDSYETDKQNPSTVNSDNDAKDGVSWKKSGEVKSTDTAQYVDETHRSPTVTITNEYWYDPELLIKKVWRATSGSTLPSGTGADQFKMKVTLTAPEGHTWQEYVDAAVASPVALDTDQRVITFYVTVTAAASAAAATAYKIKGMPVDSSYVVEELDADNPTPSGYKRVTDKTGDTGNISDSETTAVFTNTYTQLGSLKITKSILPTTNGSGVPQGGTYTITGTLTNVNLDLGTTYLPAQGTCSTDCSVSFDTAHYDETNHSLQFTATIVVPSNDTTAYVTIADIPYGTTYKLSETPPGDSATVTYTGDGSDITENSETKRQGTVNSTKSAHEVTVQNTYPDTYKLTLNKSVVGTLPTGITNDSNTKFKYHVVLEAQNGLELNRYNIVGLPSGTTYNTTSNPHKYDFYVPVPADGTNVEITGIPGGTHYTVTEFADTYYDSDNTEQSLTNTGVTTTYSYDSTAGASSGPSGENLDANKTVTVTNTYPSSGTLELRKRLAGGTPPSGVPNAGGKYYFVVTLNNASAPTIDVSKFTLTKKVGNGTATPIPATDITTGSGSISFTVELEAGSGDSYSVNDVKIGGIPYGVTYTVSESTAAGSDSTAGTTDVSTVYTDDANKKIGTGAADVVTVTNTYPEVGNLKITKTLVEGATTTNQAFSFVVTLDRTGISNDKVDLRNYIPNTYTFTKDGNDVDNYTASYVQFTLSNVTSGNAGLVTDIPYGTVCSVKENSLSGWTRVVPAASDTISNLTISGSLTVDTSTGVGTAVAGFTNAQVGDLDFIKAIAPSGTYTGTPADNGIDVSTYRYNFDVELTPPTGMSLATFAKDYLGITEANVTNADYAPYALKSGTTNTLIRTFAMQAGTKQTISGLPYGTTFTVTEQNGSQTKTTDVDYQVGDGAYSGSPTWGTESSIPATGTIGGDKSVRVTNTYAKLGSLVLQKRIDTTNGGARPEGVPNSSGTNGTAKYTLTVVLTKPQDTATYGNVNWSYYTLQKIVGGGTATDITPTSSDTDSVTYSIDIEEGSANDVTISGIPYGVTYEVTETITSQTGTSSVYYNSDATNTTSAAGTIDDSETATVNNVYPKVGDLSLTKKYSGTRPDGNLANYKLRVTLTANGTVKLSSYTGLTWPNDSTTVGTDTDTQQVRDVLVPANLSTNASPTSVSITGIPYGTTYKVEEIDSDSIKDATITYTLNGTNLASGSSYAQSTIGDSNAVIVNNSYLNTHKLTLYKSLNSSTTAEKYGVSSSTPFKYHVVLTGIGNYPISVSGGDSARNTSIDTSTGTFDVYVTPNSYVEISGLPDGAGYTVTEDTSWYDNINYTQNYLPECVTQSYIDGTSSTGSNLTADANVKIQNTYPDIQSLTLKKTIVGTRPENVPNNTYTYTFTGTLTTDSTNGADLTKYNIYGTNVTVQAGSAHSRNFTASVTVGSDNTEETVTINGLPLGTSFTVNEDSASKADTTNVTGETGSTSVTVESLNGAAKEIKNYYRVGSLELIKQLESGTTNTSEAFSYQVSLRNNNLDLRKYLMKTTSGGHDYIGDVPVTGYSADTTAGHTMSFNVAVSAGTASSLRKILNIPYGTTYTVAEQITTSGTGNQQAAGWAQIGSGTYSPVLTGTETEYSIKQAEHTFTAKNVQKGSLELKKAVEPSGSTPTGADAETYTYDVTLTAPSGVDLTGYEILVGSDTLSTSIAQDASMTCIDTTQSTPVTYDTANNVYHFRVKGISVNNSVTITELPHGTTYSVYEVGTENFPQCLSSSNPQVTPAISSNIGITGADSVTITNTYSTGSLTIDKLVAGDNGVTPPDDHVYTFVVTLTPESGKSPAVDLSKYSYTKSGATGIYNSQCTVTPLNGNSLTVTIKGQGSVTISGIPIGTAYNVTEQDVNDGSTPSVILSGTTYTDGSRYPASGSAAIAATQTVSFKNTYHDTVTLNLTKAISNNGTLPTGVTGRDFIFNVTLYSATGFSGYPITLTDKTNSAAPQSWTGTEHTVSVTVTGANTATITNLPSDTTFIVSENSTSKTDTTNVDGETGSGTSDRVAVSSLTNSTRIITNYYNVGSLKLIKQLEEGTTDTAEEFSYHVVLKNSNLDLTHYLIAQTTSNTTHLGELVVTNYSADADGRTMSFDVAVNANTTNGFKTIQNIPYGTSFTVREDIDSTNQSNWQRVTPANTDTQSGNVNNSTPNPEKTFKNVEFAKITLKKTTSGTKPSVVPNTFTFTGTFTAPSGVDLRTYLTSSTIPSRVTYTGNGLGFAADGSTFTFTAAVPTDANDGIVFTNVPMGTKYDVYEDTTNYPTSITSNHGSDNHATNTTGITEDTLITIENTYNTGSLTISKTVGADDGVTAPTDTEYTFTVTLTPQSGKTPAVDLSQYTYTKSAETGTYSSQHTVNPLTGNSLTVTIKGQGSVTISGIPTGTAYSVSETPPNDGSTLTKSGDSGSIGSTASTAYFTNTYHKKVSLTVTKTVEKTDGFLPTGVAADTEYTMLITLTEPNDKPFSAYPVNANQTMYYVTEGGEANTAQTYTSVPSGTRFAVKLTAGQSVVFTGLPDGTQYKVVESASSKAHTIGYNSDMASAVALSDDGSKNVINNYKVGKLRISKNFAGDPPTAVTPSILR